MLGRTARSATARSRVSSPAPASEGGPAGRMTVQKVKVRVYKRAAIDAYYTIDSSHPLPPANMVLSCLSQRAATIAKGWFYNTISLAEWIRSCTGGIKPAEWAEAIASATAHVLGMSAEAESELAMVSEGGYLALGNTLFKMVPTDFITTGSKALPALRRTVIADAKAQGEALIVAATDRAARTRSEADNYRSTVNRECLQIKTAHEVMRRELTINVPTWAKEAHIPLRYTCDLDGNPRVEWGMWVGIKLTQFNYSGREGMGETRRRIQRIIRCLPDARPVQMLLWGQFPITQSAQDVANAQHMITCDEQTRWLPHVSRHACMQIGDAPHTFSNFADYINLKAGIERAMSVVNVDSLLVAPDTGCSWYRELDRFYPPDLLTIINAICTRGSPYTNWHLSNAFDDAITKGTLVYEQHDFDPITEPAIFTVRADVVPSPEAPAVLANDYGDPLTPNPEVGDDYDPEPADDPDADE